MYLCVPPGLEHQSEDGAAHKWLRVRQEAAHAAILLLARHAAPEQAEQRDREHALVWVQRPGQRTPRVLHAHNACVRVVETRDEVAELLAKLVEESGGPQTNGKKAMGGVMWK